MRDETVVAKIISMARGLTSSLCFDIPPSVPDKRHHNELQSVFLDVAADLVVTTPCKPNTLSK